MNIGALLVKRQLTHKLYYANAEQLIFARKVTVPVTDPVAEAPTAPAPAH